jgi:hypothetical protein
MSEPSISDLFAEGTAPDRDPAFEMNVAADIGRARVLDRLARFALPVTGALVLSGAVHGAAEVVRPLLAPALEGATQFMGVPLPVVLVALAAGLALTARRYVLSR